MKYTLLIVTCLILELSSSCNHSSEQKRLAKINILLNNGHPDLAYDQLTLYHSSFYNRDNTKLKAYYNLLLNKASYMLYKPMPMDAPLNFSISYYKKKKDIDKLSESYFYRGAYELDRNQLNKATLSLKNSEWYSRLSRNVQLRHKIIEMLAVLNERGGNYTSAIQYSYKNLYMSLRQKNLNWIVYAMGNLAVEYYGKGKKDSCTFYLTSCLPYLGKIKKRDRAYFLANIGYIYANYDPKLAEWYLRRSIQIMPLPETYNTLADIEYRSGNRNTAIKLLHKALAIGNSKTKLLTNNLLVSNYVKEGNYKKAYNVDQKIIELTNNINRANSQEKIELIQKKFDYSVNDLKYKESIKQLWTIVIICCFIIICLILLLYYYYSKNRVENIKSVIFMKYSKDQICLLKKTNKLNLTEMQELKNEVAMTDTRRDRIIYEGKQLYENILNGGNVLQWKRTNFIHFIDYYRLENLPFVQHLENDYDNLSTRYMFFLVLENLGMEDKDIQNVMCISQSSIRSIRTRIKQKKL